jgi:colicin import membrane protein
VSVVRRCMISYRRFFLLFLAVLVQQVSAETVLLEGIETPQAVRQSVANERAQKLIEFERLERACYSQFAVNDCIKKVKQSRTQEMSELKRRLEVLESAARMQRATDQLQRLELKQKELEQRLQPGVAMHEPLHSQDKMSPPLQKKPEYLNKSQAVGVDRAVIEKKPAMSKAQTKNNQEAYQRKMEEAKERKRQRDQRMSERDTGIKGLPVTP